VSAKHRAFVERDQIVHTRVVFLKFLVMMTGLSQARYLGEKLIGPALDIVGQLRRANFCDVVVLDIDPMHEIATRTRYYFLALSISLGQFKGSQIGMHMLPDIDAGVIVKRRFANRAAETVNTRQRIGTQHQH